jgi:hypothetical protein
MRANDGVYIASGAMGGGGLRVVGVMSVRPRMPSADASLAWKLGNHAVPSCNSICWLY